MQSYHKLTKKQIDKIAKLQAMLPQVVNTMDSKAVEGYIKHLARLSDITPFTFGLCGSLAELCKHCLQDTRIAHDGYVFRFKGCDEVVKIFCVGG